MTSRFFLLAAVTAAFAVLTALALNDVGYFGIIEPHFQSWGAAQVFTDLVILAVLAIVYVVHDAPKRGLSAWPFVLITLVAGSFGILFYLMAVELRSAAPRRAESTPRSL
jgi:uncharacterized membrane protein